MTDWRQTGRDLQDWWLDMYRRADRSPERLARQRAQIDAMDPLGAAIRHEYEGAEGAVAAHLREKQLTADDQVTLARYLDGEFEPRRKSRGQPKKNARAAAAIALRFYQDWKELNQSLGISDRGHSEDMRTIAVRFVTEDFLSHSYGLNSEEQQHIVLANMARGKDRHN